MTRDDKNKAITLRKQGKSYKEIREAIGVPMSTLSDWLALLGWSKNIKQTLTKEAQKKSTVRIQKLNTIRGKHLERVYKEAEKEAREEFDTLKYHPLFIAGLMLYWGEGNKASKSYIGLANTDPKMIRLFLHFLIDVCQMPKEKLRVALSLYPDLDDNTCRTFWKKKAGLKDISFTKSMVLPSRHKTRRLKQGVCTLGCTSTYFKKKMLIWLRLLPKEMLSKKYYIHAGIV